MGMGANEAGGDNIGIAMARTETETSTTVPQCHVASILRVRIVHGIGRSCADVRVNDTVRDRHRGWWRFRKRWTRRHIAIAFSSVKIGMVPWQRL